MGNAMGDDIRDKYAISLLQRFGEREELKEWKGEITETMSMLAVPFKHKSLLPYRKYENNDRTSCLV